MTPLERVRQLLARAGHPETPDEEARTCALIAARTMYRLGFVAQDPKVREVDVTASTKVAAPGGPFGQRVHVERHTAQVHVKVAPPRGAQVTRVVPKTGEFRFANAEASGECSAGCGRRYRQGDGVIVSSKGKPGDTCTNRTTYWPAEEVATSRV